MHSREDPACPVRDAAAYIGKLSPTRRRLFAMAMLCELYFPQTHDFQFTGAPVDEIAGNIRKLAAIGRSAQWLLNIEGWAQMVEQHPDAIHWAFFQGSVFAGGCA